MSFQVVVHVDPKAAITHHMSFHSGFYQVVDTLLQLADVLRELTPLSGVAIEVNGLTTPRSATAKLVMRGLRYHMS